jgi:6-phosphogluconolactonase
VDTPELLITSSEDFPEVLSRRLIAEIGAAFVRTSACRLALTGGSIGAQLFPVLLDFEQNQQNQSVAAIDWQRLEIFWGDERAVPLGHSLSNFKQANDLWLHASAVPEKNIHPMTSAPAALEASAADYEELMRLGATDGRALDIALLGVGPDGHVCSLFPGHPLLNEPSRWVAPVHDSPKPPAERLTLTLPALFSTDLVIVAACGEQKSTALREAWLPHCETPLAHVLRGASRVLLVVDEAAAGR